jgi:hypothetical protein
MRLVPSGLFCGLLVLGAVNIATAQDAAVRQVLAKYDALRPGDDDLAIYRLDWEESLPTAQRRAGEENRPVCLVIIHARYGDITSGHC